MRVLHLIARLNDGGPARVIAALAAEHARAGCQVTVLAGRCGPGEPDLADRLRARGVAVEDLPWLGREPSPWRDARALAAVLARLRRDPPHLLHTHTFKAGAIGRLAARFAGVPVLHTFHGHVLSGYFSHAVERALVHTERLAAGNAWHHCLTPTQLIELRDRYRIGRPDRWAWLPPPVPPVPPVAAAWHAGLRPGAARVLFLGRFAAVKDPELWLAAVALLARRRPVQAVLCGEGVMRDAARRRAAELGLDAIFPGQVPAGEALAAADLLLMSSRNEGLPLVAIEAAQQGIPVVAPAVGGCADLGRWGVVQAVARTPEALAAAAETALAAPRRAPHPFAVALAPRILAPRYLALYRRVAGG